MGTQKKTVRSSAKVTIVTSRVICFHKTFYSIGFDKEKVAKGIEDKREMRSVEKSKNWNPGMCVVKNINYKTIGSSRSEMIKQNKEVMCFPVIRSKR